MDFIFSLLIFVIVSFVLWLFNVGTKSHLLLESHSSYYKGYVNHMKEQRWNQPQNGFLFGDIVDVSDGNMVIRDGSGKKWTIVFDDETRIGSYVKKIPGEKIKIIGRMTDDGEFNAYDIRPWQGFGMHEKKFR